MVFWLLVIMLLIASGALLVIPVIHHVNNSASMSRDDVNTVFYQHHLKELAYDEGQGVVVANQEVIQELQQNLLNDIPVRQDRDTLSISHWALLPGIVLLVLISLGLYVNTGAVTQVQAWQQVMTQMPQLRARVASPQASPLNKEEIAQFGLGLRTSLQFDKDNIHDWMLLGRVAMILNNASTAVQAFAHAWQRDPDNTQIALDYAEALTWSDDPEDRQQAAFLLKKITFLDKNNLRAIGLLAFNALEQNDIGQAISHWESMLPLLPADDQRAALVRLSIERAREQTKIGQGALLTVDASLTSDAAGRVPQQGILMISVSDGVNPLPVAVRQLPYSRFPLSVVLDDSHAMLPERLLSSQHQVKVKIRLSQFGTANASPGDWYGESRVQDISDTRRIVVQIDRQTPHG